MKEKNFQSLIEDKSITTKKIRMYGLLDNKQGKEVRKKEKGIKRFWIIFCALTSIFPII